MSASPALLDRLPIHGTGLQLGMRAAGTWPVHPALEPVLPGGLPRGGTVIVEGSISMVLAAIGAASAAGAWCALAGLPPVGADAVVEFGIAAERTPLVAAPASSSGRAASGRAWAGLLAALIDTVDIVAARPSTALAAGDLARLAARARSKDATMLLATDRALGWAGADLRLTVSDPQWQRAHGPRGRLVARRVTVRTQGRGRFARPGTTGLWLPASTSPVATVEAIVVPYLASVG